jgi:nucleoside-diphosphate-sugar epimerase
MREAYALGTLKAATAVTPWESPGAGAPVTKWHAANQAWTGPLKRPFNEALRLGRIEKKKQVGSQSNRIRTRGLAIRVVVTGSAGFIGKCVMTALQANGCEAVPFDIRDFDHRHNDICDPEALMSMLAGTDGVIHLAAISRVASGEQQPELCQRINVEGTAALATAILSLDPTPWLVFASSREVYGNPSVLPVDEDAPIRPINIYGRSKAGGEAILSRSQVSRRLRSAIVRLSSVYGAVNDHQDRVVPALLRAAMNGEELTITGAANRFDFVHVEDTVEGLLLAAKSLIDGSPAVPTIHLASGVGTSLSELAQRVISVTRSQSTIRIAPPRPFDVNDFIGNPARAFNVLGWAAKIGLEKGLIRLYDAMHAEQRRCKAL